MDKQKGRVVAPLRLAFDLGTFPVVIKEAPNLIGIDAGVGIPPVDESALKLKRS